MQSKTSYFNAAIFRKSVSRFWPLWLVYAAIWLVVMPVSLQSRLSAGCSIRVVQDHVLSAAIYGGLFIGSIAAVLAAMAVWSFLYSSRSAQGMACLPVRREGVFLSVTAAGILPLLAANVLIFLLSLGVEALHGAIHLPTLLEWLGAVTLILLFFYGFAVFCAQLTGNILVLPLLYLVLNFTAVVVEGLVIYLSSAVVYGLPGYSGLHLSFLSPFVWLLSACRLDNITVYDAAQDVYVVTGYRFHGWGAAAVYAAVGLVFLVLALLLFRRRRMESAGDVVAVNVLKPVFKYCLTGGCALVLGGLLYSLFFSYYSSYQTGSLTAACCITVFMLIGAFIGYFGAEMLIHKSFRVWRGKWPGFGVSALLILVLALSTELDLFGVERYVPDADKVESVHISCGRESALLEEDENIAAALALHGSIIESKDYYEDFLENQEGYLWEELNISYDLGGRSVYRSYRLPYRVGQPDTYRDMTALQELLNCDEAILQRKKTAFDFTEDTAISASVDLVLSGAECAALAGYDSVEDYLLYACAGLSESSVLAMDQEELSLTLNELAQSYAVYYPGYSEADLKASDIQVFYGDPGVSASADLDSLYFNYTLTLTAQEGVELFRNCIIPDMNDQTLGRVWLITDEDYEETVYSVTINIDARQPRPSQYAVTVSEDIDYGPTASEIDYLYDYFYTRPTVDSSRTNAWLEAHGLTLHTIAEVNGNW